LLARLTSLWFVFKTFVVKKYLLARSPDKVLGAVNTSDWAILIFTFLTDFHFQYVGGFRLCHVLLPWVPITLNNSGGRIKNYTSNDRTLFGCPPMRNKIQPRAAAVWTIGI
jgi:hypothetical protein